MNVLAVEEELVDDAEHSADPDDPHGELPDTVKVLQQQPAWNTRGKIEGDRWTAQQRACGRSGGIVLGLQKKMQ